MLLMGEKWNIFGDLEEFHNTWNDHLCVEHPIQLTMSLKRHLHWHTYAKYPCKRTRTLNEYVFNEGKRWKLLFVITYELMEIYVAKSLEMAYICPVACLKYLFPSSPNFQYSGSWYLTPLLNLVFKINI